MKKRLLFLIESMVVGGAERALVSLVNNLDPSKYDVTVVSIFRKSVYIGYDCTFRETLKPHVHYRYLVDNTNPFLYMLFNYLFNRFSKRLLHRILIGKSYEVEVAWYEGMPTTFLAHSSNTHSRKLAWLHYGAGFKNMTYNEHNICKDIYSRYDAIIGVSNGVTENFKEKVGLERQVMTCYNIMDDDWIRMKAEQDEEDSNNKNREAVGFVAVGRLSAVKGYDRLLNVCLKLRTEGFSFNLKIIGGGSEKDKLEQFIRDNSMQSYVHLLGNKDNPYPYIKNADWLVCSSYAEGFSTVLAESLIIGTPVISTDCSGTDELLGYNAYGIRCENSEKGLYDAMKSVLIYPKLHDEFQQKAIQKGQTFQKQTLLSEIEKLL